MWEEDAHLLFILIAFAVLFLSFAPQLKMPRPRGQSMQSTRPSFVSLPVIVSSFPHSLPCAEGVRLSLSLLSRSRRLKFQTVLRRRTARKLPLSYQTHSNAKNRKSLASRLLELFWRLVLQRGVSSLFLTLSTRTYAVVLIVRSRQHALHEQRVKGKWVFCEDKNVEASLERIRQSIKAFLCAKSNLNIHRSWKITYVERVPVPPTPREPSILKHFSEFFSGGFYLPRCQCTDNVFNLQGQLKLYRKCWSSTGRTA